MKIKTSWMFFCLLLGISATAQREPTPEEEAFFTRAMSQINAKHIRWVKSTALESNQKNQSPDDIMIKSRAYGNLGGMNGQDIEALAFLVLMQAAKSAQEDLKAIMAKVKSINDQKAKMRAALANLENKNATFTRVQLDSINRLLMKPVAVRRQDSKKPVTKQEINDLAVKMKGDLDSMSELGEMESLRMQMYMDRRSKMMSTLSNILKKISSTLDNIIANLK